MNMTPPMTRDEALVEARKRYGPGGWVTFNEEGRYQVGSINKGGIPWHFVVLGEAWQGWDEAFDNADARDLEE